MSKEKLTTEQQEKIIEAIIRMNDMAEVELMLQDVVRLYFMALESNIMDCSEQRINKTLTFIHLHDCLSKLDMIINSKDGCYQLAG